MLTEIALPHPQAAPAVDADLDDDDLAAGKPLEVAFVEVEVVTPLVDPGTFAMPLEVRPQGIGLRGGPTVRRNFGRVDVCTEAISAGGHRSRTDDHSRQAAVVDDRGRQPWVDRSPGLGDRTRNKAPRRHTTKVLRSKCSAGRGPHPFGAGARRVRSRNPKTQGETRVLEHQAADWNRRAPSLRVLLSAAICKHRGGSVTTCCYRTQSWSMSRPIAGLNW